MAWQGLWASTLPGVAEQHADRQRHRLLLLAGSTEASALAHRLAASPRLEVVVSFAGRVRRLAELPGTIRVGGFGGVEGMVRWLREARPEALVDATHPFAARMPFHAAEACALVGTPYLRVVRPEWHQLQGDRWHHVEDLGDAASTLKMLGARRVFLTTGRHALAPFAEVPGAWFLLRAIEPPDPMPLPRAQVLLARGPFGLASEMEILSRYQIDALVTKNSGGSAASAKLAAARALSLPVVMVRRPPAATLSPMAPSVDQALQWCREVLGPEVVP